MKKTILALLLASAFCAQAAEKYAEGRILVHPRTGVTLVDFDNQLHQQSAKRIRKIGNTYIVEVSKGDEIYATQRLRNSPLIKFAEVDKLVPPASNDPLLGSQWHHNNIYSRDAWLTTTGSAITIAICDSGINQNHQDLAGRIVSPRNIVLSNSDVTDVHGHGTAVAGSAAAIYNNAIGIAGVAGSALIMPVKITQSADAWAYYSDMAACVYYAADNGARVANISYLGAVNSSSVLAASAYMKSKGGLVFGSAGNNGVNETYVSSTDIVAVSATNSSNTKTSWSSFGEFVDLAAPGDYILTTHTNGGYANYAGTSFSSPIAAGVATLVFAVNPGLSSGQVETVLKNTAIDLGTVGKDIYYGYGLVNAKAAVEAAHTIPTDREPPTVQLTYSGTETVSGTITVYAQAFDNVGVSKVDFLVNGNILGTDFNSPYSASINTKNYANGTVLTVSAIAYDETGNSTVSNSINLVVNNPVKPGKSRNK
jgi:subtilisin family serine protease